MKKGMKSAFAATLALTACFGGISAYAAHDENLNVYTLDTVVVEADKTKNKFGDTITEQSYYRTGGWKDPAGKKTVSMYGLIRISAIPKI